MSDYIIHNIGLTVSPQLDLFGLVEQDKPVDKYPNYYLGKIIGGVGNQLDLIRTRQNGGKESVPNCVLRNEDGIALIRIHNKENFTIYDLPENTGNEVKDCVGVPKSSYPFGYVVVDYRDDKCQLAIEKTSAWDSKTVTIRYCFDKFFNLSELAWTPQIARYVSLRLAARFYVSGQGFLGWQQIASLRFNLDALLHPATETVVGHGRRHPGSRL